MAMTLSLFSYSIPVYDRCIFERENRNLDRGGVAQELEWISEGAGEMILPIRATPSLPSNQFQLHQSLKPGTAHLDLRLQAHHSQHFEPPVLRSLTTGPSREDV